jgi:hypothetical protein
MGGECFTGNNNDIDLNIKTTRERIVKHKLKENFLEGPHNSSQYIYQPRQYQNIYLNERKKISGNEYLSYRSNYYRENIRENLTNKSRTNSLKIIKNGRKKNIHNFTSEDLEDEVNDILRIRIPFFENSILKTLSAFTFLSGNGPYHEGLLFFTTNKNFYIAQSYPITFIKVYDFFGGISEIISFNNINKDSKKYTVSEIYSPQEPIKLYDVLNIINNLPNKYNLINDNCQNFCNNILDTLKNNYKIEMEEKPNLEKINFLKKQKKTKNNLIPIYRPLYYSGKFNNY